MSKGAALLALALLWPQAPAGAEEPRPLGPVYRERIRVTLREALSGGAFGARAGARFLELAGSEQPAVAAELATMLRTAERAEDRRAAAAGLGLLRRPADVPALAAVLPEEASGRVRAAVLAALGACGGPMALRVLAERAAGDAVPAVRTAAIESLHATGDPAAPWAIARSMRGPETQDGARARALLARMGFTPEEQLELGRAAPPGGAAPPRAAERWAAEGTPELLRWVLWGAGDPAPALVAALDAESPEVRGRAARTLWLREHALAGVKAARRDSFAAEIPRTIAALADSAPDRRGTARRWLAWAAGTDLGATAESWRRWWEQAQPSWRPPPGEPPGGTGRSDQAKGDRR